MTALTDTPVVPLRRNRDFLALWIGAGLTSLGGTVATVGFPLLLVFAGRSTVSAGWTGFAGLLPMLLVQLPAGVMVDRWDRRRTMIWCNVAALAAVGAVGVAVALGALWLPLLMAAAFVEGTAAIVYRLAERAAVSNVVPAPQLSSAMSQNEARTRAAGLIGQPLSSSLFVLLRAAPFLFAALSHLLALGSLLFVRGSFQQERASTARNLRRDLTEGISWVLRQRFLRSALGLVAVTNILFQILSLALLVMVRDAGSSPAVIGVIGAVSGICGVFGALAGSAVNRRLDLVTVLVSVLVAWAVLMFLISLGPPIPLLALLFASTTMLGALLNVVAGTYQLSITPDALQGRVGSVAGLLGSGANSLGALGAGFLLAAVPTAAAVAGISGVMLALAVAAVLSPAVRSARTSRGGLDDDRG
ncbi:MULTISPECIES: MFS transporter [unclassified Micromonospora]|uniref:MFS transporter n=1 Tax=unclassified Micromonospora TaxID=2617518 RepID=UPI0022CA0356|nr:MFS transporter [Micromonospora sp. AKA38]GHJ15512.1 MFS transporter [Micromonospora sp. AKA38]